MPQAKDSLTEVKMRISSHDLKLLDELHRWTKDETKAAAVSSALNVTHELVRRQREGEEFLVRRPGGTYRTIKIGR